MDRNTVNESPITEVKNTVSLLCSAPYAILQCICCPSFYTAEIQKYNVELLLNEIKLANEQLMMAMKGIESNIIPLKKELKAKTDSFIFKYNRKIGRFNTIEEFVNELSISELRDFNDIRRCESRINSLDVNLCIYFKVNEELVIHENKLESVLTDVLLHDNLSKKEYKDLFKFIDGLEIGELIKQTREGLVSLKQTINKKPKFTKDKEYLDSAKNVIAEITNEPDSVVNSFLIRSELAEDRPHTSKLKPQRVAVL
jgi:hypothetical protein